MTYKSPPQAIEILVSILDCRPVDAGDIRRAVEELEALDSVVPTVSVVPTSVLCNHAHLVGLCGIILESWVKLGETVHAWEDLESAVYGVGDELGVNVRPKG